MQISAEPVETTEVTDVAVKAKSWRDEVIPKFQDLADSAKTLTIVGCIDGEKAGFEACQKKHTDLVKARTGTEKFAKELKEEAQRTVTLVDATKREILAVTAAEEARLKSILDEYKARKERARKEALARRVDALQAVGAKFDLGDLEEMSEKDFEELHAAAKEVFLERQAREAEEAQRKELVRKRIDVLRQKQGLDLYTGDLDNLWQVDEFAFNKILASADERASIRIQAEQLARDKAALTASRQHQLGKSGFVLAIEQGIDVAALCELSEERFAELLAEAEELDRKKAAGDAMDVERKAELLKVGVQWPGYLGGMPEEEWLDLYASERSKRVLAQEMEAHQKAFDILNTYGAIPFVPSEWLAAPELARRTPEELNAIVQQAQEDALRRQHEQEEQQAKESAQRAQELASRQSTGKQLAITYLRDTLGGIKPIPAFADPNDDYLTVVLDNFLRLISDEANSIINDLEKEQA